MATDGVKIIDGDTARDAYSGIMDLYDNGADFETIFNHYPLVNATPYDEFENEIYTTACGLAYWEIGQMTTDRLNLIKSIIDIGACVEAWNEEEGKKAGVARQKVLDNYLQKISAPNPKVRPRKKYRKVTNLYFQPDDVLTFKLKNGNYRVVICIQVEQHRGQCNYVLVPTTYNSKKKPEVADVMDKQILGGTIETNFSYEKILEHQPSVDRIWNFVGGNTRFFFGVVQFLVTHKDFIGFKARFENIGKLKIIESLKKHIEYQYLDKFDGFEENLSDLDGFAKVSQISKYPIKILCEA